SDGLHTPSEVVRMAWERGLRFLAITDHDTVEGVAEAVQAAQGLELEVIPGVEISTEIDGTSVHMLGYYVDYEAEELLCFFAASRKARLERAQKILAKLQALGISLSWERILALANGGTVGRAHIARALQEASYVQTTQDAFDRYLVPGQPAYVPRPKLTPQEAIALIRRVGGLPVLAHPWGVAFILPELVSEGLVGLEVYYPGYHAEITAYLERLTRENGLICTGGSDFHGLGLLPENELGQVYVPERCIRELKERKRLLKGG
ncbi:MAG: PHP domain-containing protein, partial [Anaerolineae bacterium]|nr:PHP domain-containing protein [Anaerolineae bacterium]